MIVETLLAAVHITAILTLVVFIASSAALCRPEWFNGAALERLARLDLIYGLAAAAVLLSGLARSFWGMKGAEWYWGSPLLHLKLTLFVVVALLSLQPTLAIRRWLKAFRADGTLPPAEAILRTRRQIMRQAHLIPVIAIVAIFMARGWWH
ncbi:MAG: DUF2214 family protein [Comamonas sp.]